MKMNARARVMNNTRKVDADWQIETERLRLRAVTVDDTELMLAVWNDPAWRDSDDAPRGAMTLRTREEWADGHG